LVVVGVLCGVLAVGVAVSAFTVLNPASGVVLETETAILSPPVEALDTVEAPLDLDASSNDGIVPTGEAPPASSAPADDPPSGVVASAKVPPTGLVIESLGLTGYVRPVGLEDDGAMEVPPVTEIGWYEHGATPGHPGATVLVAHVWWNDNPGPFRRLGRIEPGATVEVETNGEVQQYQIVKRTMYDKDSLPKDLWRNTGPETLVLITCGGAFDSGSRRYEQNIVVYAVPTDTIQAGAC